MLGFIVWFFELQNKRPTKQPLVAHPENLAVLILHIRLPAQVYGKPGSKCSCAIQCSVFWPSGVAKPMRYVEQKYWHSQVSELVFLCSFCTEYFCQARSELVFLCSFQPLQTVLNVRFLHENSHLQAKQRPGLNIPNPACCCKPKSQSISAGTVTVR